MLSGQITGLQVEDCVDALLDDLLPTIQELVRRNMRYIEGEQGKFQLSQEQLDLARTLSQDVELWIQLLIKTDPIAQHKNIFEAFVKQADLELRGPIK